MKIVIIGLGKIGKDVLKNLSEQDHTITIIDENKNKVEELVEKYDVLGVVGNGANIDIQREANVNDADLAVVLTRNDELNIFACMVANRLGCKNTVARVRNPDYRKQIAEMKDDLGISVIINPERETAREIFNLINLPSVAHIDYFANGKAILVEVAAQKGCKLIGESLLSIGKSLSSKVLICAVQRGSEVFIPSGDFVIQENDKIHFTADTRELGDFLREIGLGKSPFKNVIIVGGGRIGYYLADSLSEKKYKVKLIEQDEKKSEVLAQNLRKVLVCCGDGTSHEFLLQEGLKSCDAFVALTDIDEENIVVSMFSDKCGVKKTILKVKSDELISMYEDSEVGNIVSSKSIVSEIIIGYVRALENSRGSNILTLYQLVNNQVEALEFYAKGENYFYNKALKDVKVKKNCLIACIIRNNEVIIPSGATQILQGDNVVVVTTHKNFDDLTDVFE